MRKDYNNLFNVEPGTLRTFEVPPRNIPAQIHTGIGAMIKSDHPNLFKEANRELRTKTYRRNIEDYGTRAQNAAIAFVANLHEHGEIEYADVPKTVSNKYQEFVLNPDRLDAYASQRMM